MLSINKALPDPFLLDYILAPIAMGIVLIYHLFLLYRYYRDPDSTIMGFNHRIRLLWVESMMSGRRDLLAVQTIRNNFMATSLLASSSILIASALAALTGTNDKLSPINDFIYGKENTGLSMIKLVTIMTCFLTAFICFLQSIRYLNHMNLSVNVDNRPDLVNPEYVFEVFKHSADYHSLGLRGYYFAFPALMWLFGPIPMVISAVVLVGALSQLDFTNKKRFRLGSSLAGSPHRGPSRRMSFMDGNVNDHGDPEMSQSTAQMMIQSTTNVVVM